MRSRILSEAWPLEADNVYVLVMGKTDTELRNYFSRLKGRIRNVAKAGKHETRCVAWSDIHVAVRADSRRGSFPRKELLPMALEAS